MAYGPNMLRNGAVRANTNTGGLANSAITVSGTVWPAGYVVETAWGQNEREPPTTGWGAATAVAGTNGGSWSRNTTRPASAGTWHLFARIQQRPRVYVANPPIVVT